MNKTIFTLLLGTMLCVSGPLLAMLEDGSTPQKPLVKKGPTTWVKHANGRTRAVRWEHGETWEKLTQRAVEEFNSDGYLEINGVLGSHFLIEEAWGIVDGRHRTIDPIRHPNDYIIDGNIFFKVSTLHLLTIRPQAK